MDFDDIGLPEIRDRADEYYRDHTWDDIESLPERDRDYLAFKAEAWARKAVAEDEIPERLDYLQDISRHEDWRVREAVAMALKYVNEHAFERAEGTWHEWVTHDDNCVRRACEVGLMSVPPEQVRPALELLDHLVPTRTTTSRRAAGDSR